MLNIRNAIFSCDSIVYHVLVIAFSIYYLWFLLQGGTEIQYTVFIFPNHMYSTECRTTIDPIWGERWSVVYDAVPTSLNYDLTIRLV